MRPICAYTKLIRAHINEEHSYLLLAFPGFGCQPWGLQKTISTPLKRSGLELSLRTQLVYDTCSLTGSHRNRVEHVSPEHLAYGPHPDNGFEGPTIRVTRKYITVRISSLTSLDPCCAHNNVLHRTVRLLRRRTSSTPAHSDIRTQ